MNQQALKNLKIDRAICEVLTESGSYLTPEHTLTQYVKLRVMPNPPQAEVENRIKEMDSNRLLIGVESNGINKYRLSDEGTAWYLENS